MLKEKRGGRGGEKLYWYLHDYYGGGGKRGEKTHWQEGNMVKYTNWGLNTCRLLQKSNIAVLNKDFTK